MAGCGPAAETAASASPDAGALADLEPGADAAAEVLTAPADAKDWKDRRKSRDAAETVGPAADATATAPRFDEVYEKVFAKNACGVGYCHGGQGGAMGLKLDTPDVAYDNLMLAAVVGADCGVKVRVQPGQPMQSLLWLKVAPDVAVCNGKMPPADGLSAAQAQLIYDWIAAGALR